MSIAENTAHLITNCADVDQMFVILWISWEREPSLSSNFVYIISVLVGRYCVCYIEKCLPLRRLDFFDCRYVCHLTRGGLWICNDGHELILASEGRVQTRPVFFTLSHLSLKTSSKKAQSKIRPYSVPDYEPRIAQRPVYFNSSNDLLHRIKRTHYYGGTYWSRN